MVSCFSEEIKDYFGETIGMYFAFLDFYSSALILPAAVGFCFYMFEFHKHSLYSLMILAVFNLIWSTAFMESWKRKANGLAYSWGTNDMKIIGQYMHIVLCITHVRDAGELLTFWLW